MDATHEITLDNIKKEQENIKILNDEVSVLEEELLKENDINKINVLRTKINKLNKTIKIKSNKYSEEDYYLNNGDLLFKYYSLQDSIPETTSTENDTIMNFFNIKSDNEDKKDKLKDKIDHSNIETFNKINIINKYMSQIDDTCINQNYTDNEIERCGLCGNCMNINLEDGCVV